MGELACTLVSLSGPESVHGIILCDLIRTDLKYEAGIMLSGFTREIGSGNGDGDGNGAGA